MSRDDVDPDDLAAIRDAAGVIVTRDHRLGRVTAETYPDEDELLVAWNTILAESEPGAIDADEEEPDDSAEGPSSGSKTGPGQGG